MRVIVIAAGSAVAILAAACAARDGATVTHPADPVAPPLELLTPRAFARAGETLVLRCRVPEGTTRALDLFVDGPLSVTSTRQLDPGDGRTHTLPVSLVCGQFVYGCALAQERGPPIVRSSPLTVVGPACADTFLEEAP